jgi:hypothetical protein
MPRGRPRKVPIVEPSQEIKTIQSIIADVLHDNCMIPGCTVKIHLVEASEVMDALKKEGFIIVEATTT